MTDDFLKFVEELEAAGIGAENDIAALKKQIAWEREETFKLLGELSVARRDKFDAQEQFRSEVKRHEWETRWMRGKLRELGVIQ